jgi:hypothetical protein
MSGMLEEKKT